MADLDLRAGRIRRRRGAPAGSLQHRACGPATGLSCSNGLDRCGHLCAATGRSAEAVTVWAAHAALAGTRDSPTCPRTRAAGRSRCAQARQALGPGRARAAEERGAAMSLATAAEYALMLTDPGPPQPRRTGPGEAQRPGTGAGHPGRPGPHRRPDRRPAVHQHPHRPLPPGPDPGQDRLPPPRRPDPPGPQRGPGLTAAIGLTLPAHHQLPSVTSDLGLRMDLRSRHAADTTRCAAV